MTPAARIAAAIEILDEVHAGQPADRAVSSWGRAHRFAGSKDRRAISEHVYGALRACVRLGAQAPADDARGLMLAALRDEGAGPDELAALFTGEGHAPSPLTAKEQEWAAADLPVLSEAAYMNVPDFLLPPLQTTFGDDLPDVLEGLTGRAPMHVRVNLLKTTPEKAVAALDEQGFTATPHHIVDTAFEVVAKEGNHTRLDKSRAYLDGLVELQDAGSQFAVASAGIWPGAQVVDFCAGGGGKTLALAALMENKGQIFAHDGVPTRMRPLRRRGERAGARNIQIMSDIKVLYTEAEERADLVLVDAPCSGSGAWRRNPETRWRLTEEKLAELTTLQAEILDKAAPLVKPGGALIYITCSVLSPENEDQTQAFCARHADFAPAPLPGLGASEGAAEGEGAPNSVQLLPHLTDTDGFYIVCLRRES